ncbi:conserved hypothetical protein [Treponema phagedenis]|uniref:Uncharacterized protein n=1 Tax=Treponema phagedenis TaxID=162 RepID=A0A0B7GWH4_TREPH|nr:hypothetical protein HMPREF9554_02726 [Treponema phagedenis F0421]CEM62873.1 conserved hypothetical protein [Treponema phagedenis]
MLNWHELLSNAKIARAILVFRNEYVSLSIENPFTDMNCVRL